MIRLNRLLSGLILLFVLTPCTSINAQTERQLALKNYANTLDSLYNLYLQKSESEIIELSGIDSAGRSVGLRLVIISQRNEWKFEDTVMLENGPITSVLPTYLNSFPVFEKFREIVAIGMASEEGDSLIELGRAGARSNAIAELISNYCKAHRYNNKIYTLNLGKHDVTNKGTNTSYQRRLVIVGVIPEETDDDVIFEVALKDALINDEQLEVGLKLYDNFLLEKYKNMN